MTGICRRRIKTSMYLHWLVISLVGTRGFGNVEWIANFALYHGINLPIHHSVPLVGEVDVSALADFLKLYPHRFQVETVGETTELFGCLGEALAPCGGESFFRFLLTLRDVINSLRKCHPFRCSS